VCCGACCTGVQVYLGRAVCCGACCTGVQVYLRGKAHVEWRITRGGERRTVKEDQYFIDEKAVVWGRG